MQDGLWTTPKTKLLGTLSSVIARSLASPNETSPPSLASPKVSSPRSSLRCSRFMSGSYSIGARRSASLRRQFWRKWSRCFSQSTGLRAQSTEHRVRGTEHRAQGIEKLLPPLQPNACFTDSLRNGEIMFRNEPSPGSFLTGLSQGRGISERDYAMRQACIWRIFYW